MSSGRGNYLRNLINEWKLHLSEKTFRWKLLIVPGLFLIYSAITQHLGNYIETRKGVQLEDKFLQLFPSYDFSTPIFFLLYASLFALIVTHLQSLKLLCA